MEIDKQGYLRFTAKSPVDTLLTEIDGLRSSGLEVNAVRVDRQTYDALFPSTGFKKSDFIGDHVSTIAGVSIIPDWIWKT